MIKKQSRLFSHVWVISLHLGNDCFSAPEHEQAKTSGETRGTGWDVSDAGQYWSHFCQNTFRPIL